VRSGPIALPIHVEHEHAPKHARQAAATAIREWREGLGGDGGMFAFGRGIGSAGCIALSRSESEAAV